MDAIAGIVAFFVGALLATFVLTRAFNFLFRKIKIRRYEYLSFICVSAIGIIIPTIKMGRFSGLPYLAFAIVWLLYDLKARKKAQSGIVSPHQGKMNDDLVAVRASATLLLIIDTSTLIREELTKNVEGLSDLNSDEKDQVLRILAVVLLVHAQKLLWERIITDDDAAQKFEIALYGLFHRTLNLDPLSHVKAFADYVARVGDHGQFQYVGSKICNEILKRSDGVVMHQIGMIFGTMLTQNFIQPLIDTQNMSEKDGPKIFASLEKYKEYFDKSQSRNLVGEGGPQLIRE